MQRCNRDINLPAWAVVLLACASVVMHVAVLTDRRADARPSANPAGALSAPAGALAAPTGSVYRAVVTVDAEGNIVYPATLTNLLSRVDADAILDLAESAAHLEVSGQLADYLSSWRLDARYPVLPDSYRETTNAYYIATNSISSESEGTLP